MKNKRFALLAATAVVAMGMVLTGCGEKAADPAKSGSNNTNTTDSTKTDANKETTASGDEQVIKVNGKNWAWELDKTEVKVGKPVKLIVTATEGMHGLSIDGTTVKNVHAMSGEEEVVTFTPDKTGDLMLRCTLPCGVDHGKMIATLKVTD